MVNQRFLSLLVTLTFCTSFANIPSSAGELSEPDQEKIYLAQTDWETQLQTLRSQAQELQQQGKYPQAEQKYQQIKQLLIQRKGVNSPDLAPINFALGVLAHQQQQYQIAQSYYQNALMVNDRFIPAINNLGLIAYEQGNLPTAIEYFQSVLKINSKITESKLALAVALYQQGDKTPALDLALSSFKENSQYADPQFLQQNLWGRSILSDIELLAKDSKIQDFVNQLTTVNQLWNESIVLNDQGNISEAIPLAEQALKINREIYGEIDNLNLVSSINWLALLYQLSGDIASAQPLLEDALAMNKRLFSDDHFQVVKSLNSLAIVNSNLGKFAEAELLFQEILTLYRRLYQSPHSEIAQAINNLAVLYELQGKFATAQVFSQEALAMYQQLYTEDHTDLATALNNTAVLYKSQGRLTEAEPLFLEALAMKQRLFPGDHSDVATALNNVAEIYRSQQRFAEAEPLMEEALAMKQRLFPNDHPEVATAMNNLAVIYEYQGKSENAEPLFLESLAMRKRLFANDHADVAISLNNLAHLYLFQGKLTKAEALYEEALMIGKRLFADHPNVVTSLNNLATLYQVQGEYTPALDLFTQASELEETIIADNLIIGSEQQKKLFLDLFENSTDSYISFHLQTVPEDQQAANLALTTILRRKGRILDAMSQTWQTLQDNSDSETQQLFKQLIDHQNQLAQIFASPLPNDASEREQRQMTIDGLETNIKSLEAQLSRQSAEFAQQHNPVTISAIRSSIPENGALIEFFEYHPFNPTVQNENRYGEPRYAVYVLLPSGEVKWQDLGDAKVIKQKVYQLYGQLGDYFAVNQDFDRTLARELDQLIMKPVRELVGDKYHLLISPDNDLNMIPFTALVDENNQYLLENYLITYLTSGRDLLRQNLFTDEKLEPPVLFANPNYNTAGKVDKQLLASSNLAVNGAETATARGRRSFRLDDLNDLEPLPATKVEGEKIQQLVNDLQLFTESQASENNLKLQSRPEFLHLATHGFFFNNSGEQTDVDQNNGLVTAQNPLLRSGLALAGFNQRQSGEEDGVLTALEVTGLNLRGTKLVVLSACETALGDIEAGEGVYGLRRAFTLAGAQSQLMSLWYVDDVGTQEMMVKYYQKLNQGEARGEAFRQAQLELLKSKKHAHPYFWSAFILSGDWTELTK